ncbi:MAG TPA: hypothetical protein VFV87_20950 [Pirellulaceae bacterium]|nr:hypothetical protein [Pirellulaceae bacterium]
MGAAAGWQHEDAASAWQQSLFAERSPAGVLPVQQQPGEFSAAAAQAQLKHPQTASRSTGAMAKATAASRAAQFAGAF